MAAQAPVDPRAWGLSAAPMPKSVSPGSLALRRRRPPNSPKLSARVAAAQALHIPPDVLARELEGARQLGYGAVGIVK